MHFDLVFWDEMEGVELAFLEKVNHFLLVLASLDVEQKFLSRKCVRLVEWTRGHLLGVVGFH